MTSDLRAKEALATFAEGRPVIIVNECAEFGVLGLPARRADGPAVNLLLQVGRGVLYVAMSERRLAQLGLRSTVTANTNPLAMGQTVDARTGITTGVSVADRVRTIDILVDPDATAEDLTSPGHVSTVAVHEDGVLGRFGISEALSDLAHAAGFGPAVVEINVLNDEGGTVTAAGLRDLGARLRVPVLTIADAVRYRRRHEGWSSRPQELQTRVVPYLDGKVVVLSRGCGTRQSELPVAVHSFCPGGQLFARPCSEARALDHSRKRFAAQPSAAIAVIVSERAIGQCPGRHPDETKAGLGDLVAADLAAATAVPLA